MTVMIKSSFEPGRLIYPEILSERGQESEIERHVCVRVCDVEHVCIVEWKYGDFY